MGILSNVNFFINSILFFVVFQILYFQKFLCLDFLIRCEQNRLWSLVSRFPFLSTKEDILLYFIIVPHTSEITDVWVGFFSFWFPFFFGFLNCFRISILQLVIYLLSSLCHIEWLENKRNFYSCYWFYFCMVIILLFHLSHFLVYIIIGHSIFLHLSECFYSVRNDYWIRGQAVFFLT